MPNPGILVPIDFSEPSRRALRAAGHWVRLFGGRIIPLHVYEAVTDLGGFHFYSPGRTLSGDLKTVEKGIQSLLQEFALQDVESDLVADAVVVTGKPARGIGEVSLDCDLIIISSHGRTGLSRFFLGSATGDLIRIAPVPVLVVADDKALAPMERILVATDFSSNSEAAFPWARQIAEATGAGVEALHVRTGEDSGETPIEELERRVRTFLEPKFGAATREIPVTILTTRGTPREAIGSFVQGQTFNLVALATVGRNNAERHALGSVAEYLAREVSTTLLLVNPERQTELRRLGLRPGESVTA